MVEHSKPSQKVSLSLPLSARLFEAIALEARNETPSPERVADVVRAYALEAYARNVTPERMVVALKEVIASASDGLDPRARAAFTTSLIPFALEGYYLDPWMRRTGHVDDLRRSGRDEEPPRPNPA